MSFLFGAVSTDGVEIAAATSINDLAEFTTIIWAYVDTYTNFRRFWEKGNDLKVLALHSGGSRIFMEVGRADTNALAISGNSFFATGRWDCLATTYSEADGPRLYQGHLTRQIIEEDSYNTRTVGVDGTTDDASNVLQIGNNTSPSVPIQGRIGIFMLFNKLLTLGEIQAQQYRPHVTANTVVYQIPGYNGTNTQPDWSGNNNSGTVTGATVADHVPLGPPFGFDMGWQGAFAAAAGGLSIPVAMQAYRQRHQSIV